MRTPGGWARWSGRLARRVPFTLGALLAILGCALATGAMRTPVLGSPLLTVVGYGLPALREGRPWTFAAGILFAPEPWMYLTIAAIAIGLLAPYEYRVGTLRAATIVLSTQLAATAAAAVLAGILAHTGISLFEVWAATRDVGASAGLLGAGAALTGAWPPPWRARARLALFVSLLLMLGLSRQYWDFEHLLAACLGIPLGALLFAAPARDLRS